jgi:hypothetical protein
MPLGTKVVIAGCHSPSSLKMMRWQKSSLFCRNRDFFEPNSARIDLRGDKMETWILREKPLFLGLNFAPQFGQERGWRNRIPAPFICLLNLCFYGVTARLQTLTSSIVIQESPYFTSFRVLPVNPQILHYRGSDHRSRLPSQDEQKNLNRGFLLYTWNQSKFLHHS